MSEPRSKRSSKTTDGRSRRQLIEKHLRDPDVSDRQALRIVRANLSWRDWFIQDYSRYLYWLGAIALDAFLLLWVYQEAGVGSASIAFFLVSLGIILGYLEYRGYARIWERGILESEDEE